MTTPSAARAALVACHRLPEEAAIADFITSPPLNGGEREQAARQARQWIETIRAQKPKFTGIGGFMQEFGLSTAEGIALMCVAEALLRVPDSTTANALIADKLGAINWGDHVRKSDSFFAHASVWGLMLTGKMVNWSHKEGHNMVAQLTGRMGQPVIRAAIGRAMAMLGDQFVLGRTIGEALERGADLAKQGYTLSYDMLGEGARTYKDAEHYFENYRAAIRAMGASGKPASIWAAGNISVKLSALHPRFQESQRALCQPALVKMLTTLCEEAAQAGIGLTVDAEESERLELMLDIFEEVLTGPATLNWPGLGLAVQAYQKRAPAVIDELVEVARAHNRKFMIRLVKGAYWDSEVKRAQMGGFADYPVYTRKTATDASYLACARKLFAAVDVVYPAFGTHNAYTLAAIATMAPSGIPFEFQRLQGMGEELHREAIKAGHKSRIYAPVGPHKDLLAYLVRRILENGANSSFVHQVQDAEVPIAALLHDPAEELRDLMVKRNPSIPLPPDLFWSGNRRNSAGIDLDSATVRDPFMAEVAKVSTNWSPAPLIDGKPQPGVPRTLTNPANPQEVLGQVLEAEPILVDKALAHAEQAQPDWAATSPLARADILDKASDLFETHRAELVARLVKEAGRTVKNALAEVREAVDLCRYYAAEARRQLADPQTLEGYTGESNQLRLHARGIFAAISPWNFPLAIFAGQIAAALVTGNAVIAKPAEQTPAIGYRVVQLFHAAGVPPAILAFLPGSGESIGAALVKDPRVSGVVFTGSTEVGRAINLALAEREGPLVPLIAETGGLNVMIVDSTALPEQVADDVVQSAFDSAGQRCSSLRILLLQEEVADRMLEVISGLAATLKIGDPLDLSTDIGPLIDAEAKAALLKHLEFLVTVGTPHFSHAGAPEAGHFLSPQIVEIPSPELLKREAFGPILHVVRWNPKNLPEMLKAIRASGYGLTGGIHSRRADFVEELAAQWPVGNLYVNRNMIGAIPGVQPFGGEGLSGTGPKAGGPHYLRRFMTERHLSIDTTAAGGNASLLTQPF